AIQSVRRSGKFYGGGGFEAEVTYENKRPNKVREEITFGGMTGATSFDGKNGWKIEPWGGKKDAETLSEDETKGIIEESEFEDPLFNYQQRGNKVELIGTDQIEGTDVYKLKVTLASNGDVRTYYLDAESCVPINYEVKRTVRGAENYFEVDLGDYKPVQGVLFPFSFAIGAKGSSSANKAQYSWERISLNMDVADRRFERPAAGEKLETAAEAAAKPRPPATLPASALPASGSPVSALPASGQQDSRSASIVDSETTSGLGARNIGSAAMSGRLAALAPGHA